MPETHFKRNRIIVECCHLLIACPYSTTQKTGGTLYTLNYAKKVKKRVLTFYRTAEEQEAMEVNS